MKKCEVVSERSLSGVVDFEEACIGDPAQDLLRQQTLGQAFFDEVVAAYCRCGGQLQPSFEHRLHHLRILRLFFSFVYHAEADDPEQVLKCIINLRRSALFES